MNRRPLSDEERALYEWQHSVDGFGDAGQERLKAATVLVSRCGGVGGCVAQQLAAAGVGRLILAHAGIGQSRIVQAAERLRAFNPFVEVVPVAENVTAENAHRLVQEADVVACCAPLFRERLLLNAAAVRHRKPLVDCAMFELEMQLTTVLPGQSPCLACLYPQEPPQWQRRFPVFGAVAATVGSLGAMEVVKVLAGLGAPLAGRMLIGDLGTMTFRTVQLRRRADCAVCSSVIGS